ncbi:LamG domain-containing protein [Colwellia sp. BRX10-3]|uniref:LamG domain-containing protein n=1 Tax=Colwellia sp. BRX10-3 TaxID=2759844 RepID=UPI0015F3895F|nr:LamG domain-containing protein [Colwellia sp. BRX10-3]MBA6389738.1 LamG domain-containing protein [Colwellia sp. BRX10-3]
MKYLLLLVVCLLSFSASAFEDILYDFKTRTTGNNIVAYKGSTSTQVPSSLVLGAQVSSVEYNALKVDDQSYQQTTTSTNNHFPYTQFEIYIDEDETDITKFTILWNGYGTNDNNGRKDGVDFYIWNFRLNSYQLVDRIDSTSNEISLGGQVTSSMTDYFGGTNQNAMVLYVVAREKKSGNVQSSNIYSDYVSLTVTDPPPAFAMANFQFDECAYTGTGNEVIDQLGNYSGTSHNNVDTSVDAQIERALAITNAAHHMQTSIPLPNRYSVSTWFKKPTATTGNRYFVLGAMENGSDLLVIDRDNDWRWAIYSSNPAQVINGTYSLKNLSDSWHHMALVYKNGQTNLYIDGVFIEAINLIPTGTLKYVGTSFDDLSTPDSQGFRAPLDEFIVFNGALTANEVATIYNNQRVGANYDGGVRASPNCVALIAQFSLDESSWSSVAGEVIDSAGNYNGQAFNGTNTALASPALTGNPGTCGYGVFDGVDDYVELPSSFENLQDNFTIAAWIKPSDLDSGSRIFIDDENNQQGYGFSLSDEASGIGNLRFYSRGVSPVFIDTTSVIAIDTWTFVTAVHNSVNKTRQIYINGVAQTLTGGGISQTYTGSWGVDTGPASIGGETANSSETGSSFHFAGAIDEVHVFKGALNASEINQLYTKTHACVEPVIHHYEIVHDGNGLTCAAEPITIKACTNSACTSESTASVSLDFNITSPTTGIVTKASPTFIGSTIIDLSHTTAETITLSINNTSIAASNAVECSGVGTSCDMTFADAGFRFLYGDTNSETIGHQTSGVEFVETLKLQAVKSNNGVCEGLFNGNVSISLSQQNVTPDLAFNAGLAFQSGGTNIAKHPLFTDNVSVNFGNDSIAIIPTPKYLDAGEIRLNAKYANADFTIVGSSNDFWVKPDSFEITATNLNGALNGNSAISTTIHNAGNNFEFTVSALNVAGGLTQNYRQADGQLQLKVSRIAPLLNGTVDGNFIYAAGQSRTTSTGAIFQNALLTSFTEGDKGTAVFSGAQYNEVGVINIDIQDINYGGLGNVNGLIEAVDKDIGRFTPAYFKQSVKAEHKGKLDAYHSATGSCAIADWAYTGQRTSDDKGAITYSLEPKITITAYNANDGVTKNYTLGEPEGFMKLLATGVDIKLPTHDETQQIVGSLADNPVALTAVMLAGNLSASLDVNGNFIAGEWLYTFSSDDHFSYNKNETSFLVPFNAQIPFVTNQIEDSDGVLLSSSIDATEKLLTDGVEIRFARMVLENSYGSENTKLRAPLNVQVYDGANFTINTDESCLSTLIGDKKAGAKYSGNMNLWDYRLIDIDTDAIQVSDTIASVSGVFNLGIQAQLSFSTPGKQGTLEWEYEVPSWLKFKWDNVDTDNDGNFYDDNPSAILSFGIYRGNDRIISWREIAN